MYSYGKQKKLSKRKLLMVCIALLIFGAVYVSYVLLQQDQEDTAVFKEEDTVVLQLPDMTQKGVLPFTVKAQTVLEYYDGSDHDVESITEFEGVYRANQGIDYALDGEAFEVIAIFSGTVTEVKDDELFGSSVTIQTGDSLTITYQSLADVTVAEGDEVSQQQVFAKAGENIYNKELGVHLHVVVEKDGVIIDPKLIYDKSLDEIE